MKIEVCVMQFFFIVEIVFILLEKINTDFLLILVSKIFDRKSKIFLRFVQISKVLVFAASLSIEEKAAAQISDFNNN